MYAKHLLNGEFDATHDIMGDLGHTQPIFQGHVDFDNNLFIDYAYLDALIGLFWRQKYCLPIMEARSSDTNDSIAFASCLDGDGMDGIWQNFNLTQGAGAVLWLD